MTMLNKRRSVFPASLLQPDLNRLASSGTTIDRVRSARLWNSRISRAGRAAAVGGFDHIDLNRAFCGCRRG